ncbi:MAG: hypothetical protein KGY54_07915 [Oleiphilaceae bacterium]|nr:hypothetical protein [Oleiphilaceae bacterium]
MKAMMKTFSVAVLVSLLSACASNSASPEDSDNAGVGVGTSTSTSTSTSMLDDLRSISLKKVEIFSAEGGLYLELYGAEKMIENAKQLVRNNIGNTESARFRNLRVVDYAKGSVVCGEVKARNEQGTGPEYTPFVAGTSDSHLETSTEFVDINKISDVGMMEACQFQ